MLLTLKSSARNSGCEVVEISALKGTGIKEAADKAVETCKVKESRMQLFMNLQASVEDQSIAEVEDKLGTDITEEQKRFLCNQSSLKKMIKLDEQLTTIPDVSDADQGT